MAASMHDLLVLTRHASIGRKPARLSLAHLVDDFVDSTAGLWTHFLVVTIVGPRWLECMRRSDDGEDTIELPFDALDGFSEPL